MADRLVDLGEAVDVEHDEGDRALVAPRPGELERRVLTQMAEVVHARQRVARLGVAVVAHQPQVLEGDVGLVGEARQQAALHLALRAVFGVDVAVGVGVVGLELADGVAQAPAKGLLGDDGGAGDALEHAVDEAALEVAERAAGGRQAVAGHAFGQLDQDLLFVELDLELAEHHRGEPRLEVLDRAQLEIAAEALGGDVHDRARALAERFGQQDELDEPEQRRRHAHFVVGRFEDLGRRGHGARLFGAGEGDQVAERAREQVGERELLA